MINQKIESIFKQTIGRYSGLKIMEKEIWSAFEILKNSYLVNHKLLICGNGGSASDADHIVGELMKSFALSRKLPKELQQKLRSESKEQGEFLATNLQPGLRAISLTSHSALNTAVSNDIDSSLIFAQQIIGYGDEGDVLLAISTSGNSKNVLNAVLSAKAMGLKTIGLTGAEGGKLAELCDVAIKVEGKGTASIQELHLPTYHLLCMMLEIYFFDNE